MRGFSLLELSIIIVIIGLIAGGLMAGKELIRAAEARSVMTDFEQYNISIHTFRDKYMALPGDMKNATNFWGIAGGNGQNNVCYITVSTGTATCNGNGDGKIMGSNPHFNEWYRFWQHLANAGMVQGSYIGTNATNAGHSSAFLGGINVPDSDLGSSAFWYAGWFDQIAGTATNFATPEGNMLRITNGALAPQESWSIDSKIDDGLPGTGKMMVYKGSNDAGVDNCSTAGGVAPPGDAGATYNFTETAKVCTPWIFF